MAQLKKTKFEVATISDVKVTIDLSAFEKTEDLYFNATEFGKVFDKKVAYWLRLDETIEYAKALVRAHPEFKGEPKSPLDSEKSAKSQSYGQFKDGAIPLLNRQDSTALEYGNLVKMTRGRYGGIWDIDLKNKKPHIGSISTTKRSFSMSKIIKSSNSRQSVEIRIENGFTFYRPIYKKEWYASGPEMCKMFGAKNPVRSANKIWANNKEWLEEDSVLIEIPTKTDAKGTPVGGVPLKHKNTQIVRCYDRSGAWFFTSRIGTKDAKKFMKLLFKAFDKILRQKTPEALEWNTARSMGISVRKNYADIVKLFTEYAKSAGSKNFLRYYQLTTDKMRRRLGTYGKKKNDYTPLELVLTARAEEAMGDLMLKLMDGGMYYKDIFKELDKAIEAPGMIMDYSRRQLEVEHV